MTEPPPRSSESRGITTAAMLLLAAGIGLLGLESCTQVPEAKTRDPVAKDVKDVKEPEVKDPPKDPEPMPPPAT